MINQYPDEDLEDSTENEDEDWISEFVNMPGNEYFCKVELTFLEDNFNLFGLSNYFPDCYRESLDIILGKISSYDTDIYINKESEKLYGLIHARYIQTQTGLKAMVLHIFLINNYNIIEKEI